MTTSVAVGVALLLLAILGLGGVAVVGSSGQRSAGTVTPMPFALELILSIGAILLLLGAMAWVLKELRSPDNDAFGLPPGTIRAVLAISLIVALVVIGERFMARTFDPPETLTRVSAFNVETTQVQQQIDAYGRSGLLAVATPAPAVNGQPAPEGLSQLTIYSKPEIAPAVEVGRSMVSSLLTLVASVVSFYFGSRAVENVRQSDTSTSPAAQQQLLALRTRLKAARDKISSVETRRDANQSNADLKDAFDKIGLALSGTPKLTVEDLSRIEADLSSFNPAVAKAAVQNLQTFSTQLDQLETAAKDAEEAARPLPA